jgi:hypothetical protein
MHYYGNDKQDAEIACQRGQRRGQAGDGLVVAVPDDVEEPSGFRNSGGVTGSTGMRAPTPLNSSASRLAIMIAGQ